MSFIFFSLNTLYFKSEMTFVQLICEIFVTTLSLYIYKIFWGMLATHVLTHSLWLIKIHMGPI